MLTLSVAQEINLQVRDIFSNKISGTPGVVGYKTTNKTYNLERGLQSQSDDRKSEEKMQFRNEMAVQASEAGSLYEDEKFIGGGRFDILYEGQKLYTENMTSVQYGRFIRTLKHRSGNCHEMACVAASFVYEIDSKVQVACVKPGDHVFCVSGPADDWKKISVVPEACEGAIVIDPWANIACYVKDYAECFRQKMEKWASIGKIVMTGSGGMMPNSPKYLGTFLMASIDKMSAYNSPTGSFD